MSENEEKVVAPAEEAPAETMEDVVMNDGDSKVVTMRKLLESGVHYGHQTRRWNPKMGKYIYGARNGIYIIDLVKTIEHIEVAYAAMKKIVEDGGKVLFVGTNEKYSQIIVDEATRSGSFYIQNRWLGGTLTNFKTILTRTRLLKELEIQEADGSWAKMSKKEVAKLRKLKEKLVHNIEGIKEMRKVPNAMFVIDPDSEHNAVMEAKKLNIPVFALCDTNVDPDMVDYVIPGNDDVLKSVQLISALMADAVCEAKGGLPTVAFTKDEGEEVTMKDVIKQADKENQERLAAIRAARKEKQERFEKMQAERAARRRNDGEEEHYQVKSENSDGSTPTDKPAKKTIRKPMNKKPISTAPKAEEVKAEEPKTEEAPVAETSETKGE